MRSAVLFIALVLSAVVIGAGDLSAATVSKKTGASICSGKPKAGSGCSWCGKINCTNVACGAKTCSVVIVRQGPRRAPQN